MVNIINKKDCSGCRACEQKCPKNAITMQVDNEGFWYPLIDEKLCIDCNLCNKVCHIENEYLNKESFDKPITYAAWNNNAIEREIASSGGSFVAIAEYIFSLDGIVCGAGFDKELNVIHKFVTNTQELKDLKGSKYVQSNTNKTFSKTKEFLDNNKVVLYTGTPCQISGLRSFLGREYENLYTCDLVCHGVPSPKVYKKYLNERKTENKSNVKEIFFRNKDTGWKNYSIKMNFENNTSYIEKARNNKYIRGFLKDIYLRPSCYDCKSSKLPRSSDITLGDFWGVGQKYPNLDDDKGTSLLLINTKKGKELLGLCKDKLYTKECDLDYAIKCNKSIVDSVAPNKNRKVFFEDLDDNSFEDLSKKYFPPISFVKKIYYKGRSMLSKTKKLITK
jgi:coenzyme F420-reducing hydrogenase beta subunit